ncbi:hypothetical protein JMJ77_0006333, partial [Colletotrichum scovillei]
AIADQVPRHVGVERPANRVLSCHLSSASLQNCAQDFWQVISGDRRCEIS